MTELPDRLDVVAVGPHPDDVEITCGADAGTPGEAGLSRRDDRSDRSGEPKTTSRYRGDPPAKPRRPGAPSESTFASTSACQTACLWNEPDGRFRLGTELRRFRPSVLITVASRTPAASPDHHQGHLLVEAGRFYSQLVEMG